MFSIGGCVSLLMSLGPLSLAQTEMGQAERAAQEAPAQEPIAQPDSQPLPLAPAPSAAPTDAHRTPPTTARPTDDGLDVPPTLAPIAVDAEAPATAPSTAQPLPPSPAVHFGERGQWVMMGSSNGFSVSNVWLSNSEASSFYAGAEVGLDYFVVNGVSIGFDADAVYRNFKGYGATTLSETTSTFLSGGIRFGANARLGESFSFYPRLTLMLESSHSTIKPISSANGEPVGAPVSSASVGPAVNFYAPLLLHPASHFVVGFGPRLHYNFAVIRGGPYDGAQSTWLSADFTVGGWWGGEAPNSAEQDDVPSPDITQPKKPAEPAFGRTGQIVLTSATEASIGHGSYSQSKGSSTSVTFAPGIDYFVSDGTSIGGEIVIDYSNGKGLDESGANEELSSTSLGFVLRAGYNLRLADVASIWLNGGVGYGSVDSSVSTAMGTNQHTRTRGWIEAAAPLLVHPASHFFVGAGPALFHELSDRDQYNYENKATQLALRLVLGGWFGGPSNLVTLVPPGK